MNRFAQAIEQSRVEVVPKILIGGGGAAGRDGQPGTGVSGMPGNVMEALLAMLLSDKMSTEMGSAQAAAALPRAPGAEQIRQKIEADMGR
jgi:hypothetical protein